MKNKRGKLASELQKEEEEQMVNGVTPNPALVALNKKLDKQLEKEGYTVERDKHYNNQGQLLQGAKGLLHHNYATRLSSIPENWDTQWWNKACGESYEERLIISASLLIAEYNRVQP